MPCPGCSTPQGLPLHMCGWLPVFLALPISHPHNGCRLQGSFSAPWGFLSAGTPSHITVCFDAECNCARVDCLCEWPLMAVTLCLNIPPLNFLFCFVCALSIFLYLLSCLYLSPQVLAVLTWKFSLLSHWREISGCVVLSCLSGLNQD